MASSTTPYYNADNVNGGQQLPTTVGDGEGGGGEANNTNKPQEQQQQSTFNPVGYVLNLNSRTSQNNYSNNNNNNKPMPSCSKTAETAVAAGDDDFAIASSSSSAQVAVLPKREPNRCHDIFWALLFYANLIFMIYCTAKNTPKVISDITENVKGAQQKVYESEVYYSGNANGGGDDDAVRRLLSLLPSPRQNNFRFLEDQQNDDENDDANNNQANNNQYNYQYQFDDYYQDYVDDYADDNNNNNNGAEQQQQQANSNNNNNNFFDDDLELDIDLRTVIVIVCISTLLSLVVATSTALGLLVSYSYVIVKLSLYFNVALFAILSLIATVIGALSMGLVLMCLTAIMCYYAYRVWDRIPFAASNLHTAVSALKANLGLALYAYLAVLTVFGWTLWWCTGALSTIYVMNGCGADGNCESDVNAGVVFFFLLSYYWTTQVIGNVVHCSTAGTVGTWWYAPSEANGFCSRAVRDSYVRSLTYSFGSIAFASLVVAIIQSIRELIHSLRDNGDSLTACCAECVLGCIESLVELFNRFALIYVAVHGQSFLGAGRSVMDIFRARGWTTIITDYMVDTVLSMMSIGVGLLVGLIAVVIGSAMKGSEQTLFAAFMVGFIVGYAVCSTLLSVVSSAVNTVIVCYAEAPNEFQANHPVLSNKMRQAWRQAWPNEFSY